jgi:hypothetical protein
LIKNIIYKNNIFQNPGGYLALNPSALCCDDVSFTPGYDYNTCMKYLNEEINAPKASTSKPVVISPREIKPLEKISIVREFCPSAKFKKEKDKCIDEYIKKNPGFFAVDKIIKQSDLLKICNKYNPSIKDENKCIDKYKTINKYKNFGRYKDKIYFIK